MGRFNLTFAVALVAVTVTAAPRIKDRSPSAAYYPTKKGATWTYLAGDVEHTFVVTGVATGDDGLVMDVAVVRGDVVQLRQQILVSEKGVLRLSNGGAKHSTPECLLKLPHTDGATWEFETNPGDGVSKMTAVRREKIEVPAGTYETIRVEREGSGAATYWFAEGVGIVKVTYPGGEWALKSSTTGKG